MTFFINVPLPSGLSEVANAICPLFVFFLATIIFCLAVQRQFDTARWTLTIVHVVGVAVSLGLDSVPLVPFNHALVPSALIITLHTASVLVMERKILNLPHCAPPAERLRAVFRVWANPRRVPLLEHDKAAPGNTSGVKFAILRCGRAAALLVLCHLAESLTANISQRLHLNYQDFGPDRQGFLPPMTRRDVSVRALMSFQWLCSTYSLLTSAHDLLAVLFVSVLRWDLPGEWPALFGGIHKAYSLRQFWGVFWHRLHVRLFDAYMPPAFRAIRQPTPSALQAPRQQQRRQSLGSGVICAALRALWMFLLSAVFHAVSNWILTGRAHAKTEVRFFLSNYVVCLVETVLERGLKRVWTKGALSGGMWAIGTRLIGYIWVVGVFFCLAPAWQYPLINAALGF